MKEIESMTDDEVMSEIHERGPRVTPDQFVAIESKLALRAACLGWTGNPLKQPARAVLCATRQVQGETA